jgi:hypothetical protein
MEIQERDAPRSDATSDIAMAKLSDPETRRDLNSRSFEIEVREKGAASIGSTISKRI